MATMIPIGQIRKSRWKIGTSPHGQTENRAKTAAPKSGRTPAQAVPSLSNLLCSPGPANTRQNMGSGRERPAVAPCSTLRFYKSPQHKAGPQ